MTQNRDSAPDSRPQQQRKEFSRLFVLRYLLIADHLLKDEGSVSCLMCILSWHLPNSNLLMTCLEGMEMHSMRTEILNLFDSLSNGQFGLNFDQLIQSFEPPSYYSSSFNIALFNQFPVPLSPLLEESPKLAYLIAVIFAASQKRQRVLVLVCGDALLHHISGLLQRRLNLNHRPLSQNSNSALQATDVYYSSDSTEAWYANLQKMNQYE